MLHKSQQFVYNAEAGVAKKGTNYDIAFSTVAVSEPSLDLNSDEMFIKWWCTSQMDGQSLDPVHVFGSCQCIKLVKTQP